MAAAAAATIDPSPSPSSVMDTNTLLLPSPPSSRTITVEGVVHTCDARVTLVHPSTLVYDNDTTIASVDYVMSDGIDPMDDSDMVYSLSVGDATHLIAPDVIYTTIPPTINGTTSFSKEAVAAMTTNETKIDIANGIYAPVGDPHTPQPTPPAAATDATNWYGSRELAKLLGRGARTGGQSRRQTMAQRREFALKWLHEQPVPLCPLSALSASLPAHASFSEPLPSYHELVTTRGFAYPDDWHTVIQLHAQHIMNHTRSSSSSSSSSSGTSSDGVILPYDIQVLIMGYCVPLVYLGRYYERRNRWSDAFHSYQLAMIHDHHPYAAAKVAFTHLYGLNVVSVNWSLALQVLYFGICVGSDECISLLGVCYFAGFGVISDSFEAVALLRSSRCIYAYLAMGRRLIDVPDEFIGIIPHKPLGEILLTLAMHVIYPRCERTITYLFHDIVTTSPSSSSTSTTAIDHMDSKRSSSEPSPSPAPPLLSVPTSSSSASASKVITHPHNDVRAITMMATCWHWGIPDYLAINKHKALAIRVAIGDVYGDVHAQCYGGIAYRNRGERDIAYRLLRQSSAQGFPEAENSLAAMLTMDCDRLQRFLEIAQHAHDGDNDDDKHMKQRIEHEDIDGECGRLSNMISYSPWQKQQSSPLLLRYTLVTDDDQQLIDAKWGRKFEESSLADARTHYDAQGGVPFAPSFKDSPAPNTLAWLTRESRRIAIAGHRCIDGMSSGMLRAWINRFRHEVNHLLLRSAASGDAGALYEIGSSHWYADRFGYLHRDPEMARKYVAWAAIAGDKQAPELLQEIDAAMAQVNQQIQQLVDYDDDHYDPDRGSDGDGDGDGDEDDDLAYDIDDTVDDATIH